MAEEITNRFLNVIWLLNRSIPIIAIQLSALVCDGKLILNFTKVLDIIDQPAIDEEEGAEPSDRYVWGKWASPASLKSFDATLELLHAKGLEVKGKYRKNDIMLVARNNFGALDLVQKGDYCRLRLWPRADDSPQVKEQPEKAGVMPGNRKDSLALSLTPQVLKEHGDAIAEAVRATAVSSGGGLPAEQS